MGAVFWKELTDYLGSRRFVLLLLAFVVFSGLWALYVASQSIRGDVESVPTEFVFLRLFTTGSGLRSFVVLLAMFGPLIGLALGFDAISGERSRRTLGRLLSQPVYRDAVINGKFLAGATTVGMVFLAIFLIIVGMGMWMLGFPPAVEEMARMGLFLVLSVLYITFWLGVAMLASVFFDRPVLSLLVSIGLWLFFSFFILMVADFTASAIVPETPTLELAAMQANVEQMVLRFSPVHLFREAADTLLTPAKPALGAVLISPFSGRIPGPLSLSQSLLLVWPHLIALVGLTAVTFAVAYIRFMREEIRT